MRVTPSEQVVFDPAGTAWIVAVGPTGVRKPTFRRPERMLHGLIAWRLRKRRTFTVAVRPNTLLRRSDVYAEEFDRYDVAVVRASVIAEQIQRDGVEGLGSTT